VSMAVPASMPSSVTFSRDPVTSNSNVPVPRVSRRDESSVQVPLTFL
jgi:hypothetical protein